MTSFVLDELSWVVRATVRRIVDGDTFVADLDLGWGVWKLETSGGPCRVRILNYDTPERGTTDYIKARDILTSLIPIDSKVWVVSTKLDSFGRALCHVYLPDGTPLMDLVPPEWKIK